MSSTVNVIVLESLLNTEFQITASPEPQDVPAEAVERWPSKFEAADAPAEISADAEDAAPASDEEE